MESALAEAAAKEGEGVGGGIVPRTEPLGAEKGMTNRKEKRKVMKKMKRKQTRKEMALKEREEHDAILNDPLELAKITMIEQEEAKRSERERKIFEEREKAWMEAMEVKRKKQIEEEEEEERRRIKALEEEDELRNEQVENANDGNEVDEWDYEEGPAEIIWQGNEIILKKKRVKIPKKNTDQESRKKDSDRPTSNPLPPQSKAFSDYKSSSMSAQQLIESVAQQVPHFGTEQDKAHCPFHLKTGACRFGQRCSRVHFCPDKSSTLLIKNMYNGPGLAWEQDEGLEYTDEEVERCFEEFYEDVHTEFLKFGEIINFKVCRNGAFHLRGNVYIHYKSLDSAVVAYQSVNGRYFAGKQISCEFINVTRWKVAICGEYMKSRYKTCSRGTACNFIHCFRNPGGDYEWADSDRPPPKFWARKMVALFGYSDADDKPMVEENFGQWRNTSKMSLGDSERYGLRRSRSRGRDSDSGRRYDNENNVLEGTCRQKRTGDEDLCEENKNLRNYNARRSRKWDTESDGELLEREIDRDRHRGHTRHSSRQQNRDHMNKTYETESDGDLSQRNRIAQHGTRKSSSQQRKVESPDEYRDRENKNHEVNWDWSDRDRDKDAAYHDNGRHSGQRRKVRCRGDHKDINNRAHDTDGERSDSNMKGDEHHSGRKSMGPSSYSSKASKFSNHGGRTTRSYSTDLSDDLLENNAERPPCDARKRSKRLDEVSDISDDDKVPTLDKKHRRDHLSIEMREADSLVENLKSRGTHESSSVGPDDIRFNSDVLTDKEDRWEPENSSVENGIYHTSKRKAGSSESCDSGRPGPSKGRDESSDFDSELYYYGKIGREKDEKSDRVTHSEHGKSRRKSRNKDRKLDSDNRPRQGSSQSSHRRRSSGLDDATDSSDGDRESVRKHKRHLAGHRSRDHKRRH
ncbi:zinc finger CCCH domain-containing protein 5-like [Pyrus communis]|uniref:zinc finger CCCH domain-containing protein 5-like n=1 Tax=Pyrus communis TaxID=23211 RepID=UPI0035C19587